MLLVGKFTISTFSLTKIRLIKSSGQIGSDHRTCGFSQKGVKFFARVRFSIRSRFDYKVSVHSFGMDFGGHLRIASGLGETQRIKG